MVKNKEETKLKILEAVESIILRDGFAYLGINFIAKEAAVDKVLIYRYFTNLNGLLKEFIRRKDYFANTNNIVAVIENADKTELIVIIKSILIEQLKFLLNNKVLQEILIWELSNKNEVTDFIANEREKAGVLNLNAIAVKFNKNINIEGISSIIVGGIYYLVLRSKTVSVFNGVDINTEKGWLKIQDAINIMVDILFLD
ncbi:MAG: TetR/AcrR family transcriptional regulator [bacterium]